MSVELGGGPTGNGRAADALRGAGQHPFAHLYQTLAESLFDYCAGLLGDPVVAADMVQDSLVAVDARIGQLPEADQLRVWLYAAARRQCRSRRRPSRLPGRRPKLTWHFASAAASEPGADGAGSEVAGTGPQTQLVVTAALARLPERDREVLNLAFRHAIRGPDLAAVLGVSPRRAHALLSGASARFRESATVVVILRAGQAGCQVLQTMAGSRDPPPLLGRRLARHVGSCHECARIRGDRAIAADLVAEVPLATPPFRLRLRIRRTALALGAYRRTVVCRRGVCEEGSLPVQPAEVRMGRGGPKGRERSDGPAAALPAAGRHYPGRHRQR